MVDPITLAVVTSGATAIGVEIAKGVAGAVGEDVWKKIKALLGFSKDPEPHELPRSIATKLHAEPDLLPKLQRLIETYPTQMISQSMNAPLIGEIKKAENVGVAGYVQNMTFGAKGSS